MRSIGRFLVVTLLFATGCATKIYQGPTTGRSAEQQLTVSAASDVVAGSFDLAALKGKKVYLRLFGLTPGGEDGVSPEEAYLRNLLVEQLVQQGTTVVDDPADADLFVAGTIRAAGVDVIRRDFPPFYHHTTFRGLVDLRLVTYAAQNGVIRRIVDRRESRCEVSYREIYLFYIIGPFRTTDVASPQ